MLRNSCCANILSLSLTSVMYFLGSLVLVQNLQELGNASPESAPHVRPPLLLLSVVCFFLCFSAALITRWSFFLLSSFIVFFVGSFVFFFAGLPLQVLSGVS